MRMRYRIPYYYSLFFLITSEPKEHAHPLCAGGSRLKAAPWCPWPRAPCWVYEHERDVTASPEFTVWELFGKPKAVACGA